MIFHTQVEYSKHHFESFFFDLSTPFTHFILEGPVNSFCCLVDDGL